ncbi:hypothetical protein ATCC90586_005464 [Pythium insidiosum]|nr:hypothetical protein ATCC90586_005464 [Pythium insidiosum]
MVATPSKLVSVAVLIAACLATKAQASSMDFNPTMPVPDIVPLNDEHPALGALPPSGELMTPIVPTDPNAAVAETLEIKNTSAVELPGNNQTHRSLEASNNDVKRLETYFGQKLERNFDVLSTKLRQGAFDPIPWPSSYWPVYQDSINARWGQGEASPAEKYARAFGLNVKSFMDGVSRNNGIDSQAGSRQCTSNNECGSSACAKREGRNTGYCIPRWFGICHAWAPAAILEPEPKCSVVKNGVTFRPFDVKALITAVYDGAQIDTVFTGARFNGPDEPANLDKYGRYTDAARRDLGAGFFHLAVANIMGKFKQSFVVDVTAGSEVWNQPVRSYEVTQMRLVDPASASRQLFGTDQYPFNPAMKYLAYTTMRFKWIVEGGEDGALIPGRADVYTRQADYEYLLELDENKNVIGGEWLRKSRYEHPDFLWFATARPSENTVTRIGLSAKEVRALVEASSACKPLDPNPAPQPTTTRSPVPPSPTTRRPVPQTSAPPAPTPAPTQPQPQTFCSFFSNKYTCRFWIWCGWDYDNNVCYKRW